MDKKRKLPLIYVIGIPIIFVFANALANIHFTILGSPLYISVCLYPLIYLITGLAIIKADYKHALLLMILALVAESLTSVAIWIITNNIDAYVNIYSFLSFLLCQLIFIYIYDFLRRIKRDTYIPIFFLMVLVEIVDHAFFGPLIEGQTFSVSILVRVIYALVIPVVLAKKTIKQ